MTLAAGVSTAVHARAMSASDILRRERLVQAAETPAAATSVGGLDAGSPLQSGSKKRRAGLTIALVLFLPSRGTLFQRRRGLVFPDDLGDNRAAEDRHEVLETLASFYKFFRGDLTTFPNPGGKHDLLSPFDVGYKRDTVASIRSSKEWS